MFKKISTIIIIFFLILIILSPNVLSSKLGEKENNKIFNLKTIFATNPSITLDYEPIKESIIPDGSIIKVPLKISFNLKGFFANLHAIIHKSEFIKIELSIEDKPDWCEASVEPFVQLYLDETIPSISELTFTVTDKAPAFAQESIIVKATSQEISGLFFTHVSKVEESFNISFEVGYLPELILEIDTSFRDISPLKMTMIPIILKNTGNGPTNVEIEIENIPKKWNFSYPENVVLDSPIFGQENEKEIDIGINPSKYFTSETITVSFTPSYPDRPDLEYKPQFLRIVLENDGSILEEGSDFTLLIFVFVTIIIIIFILIFSKKKFFNN